VAIHSSGNAIPQAGSLYPIAMGNYYMCFRARTNRTNQSHFFLVIQHPSSDRPAVIILQPLLLKLQGNLSTSVAIVHLSFPYHHLPLYRFLMPAEPAQPAVTAATATTKAKHGHAASTAQPAPRKVRFNVGEKAKCLRI